MNQPQSIPCRSYTHARRYPWVIGKIGGFSLPTQLSPTQVLVLVGSFVLMLKTRRVWAHLPGALNLLLQVLGPCLLAWSVRHLRMEGRPPWRALTGYATLVSGPRRGLVQGRPATEGRQRRLPNPRVRVICEIPAPAGHADPPSCDRRCGPACPCASRRA